jgi:predicted phosphodiesterase
MTNRVLIIGDLHCPVDHPGYLAFCQDIYDQWDCNQTIFIGDVVDHQAISFHANNPNCPGPDDEYTLAKQSMNRWYQAFPEAKVCIGNHDERVIRLAESVNIPSRYLRDYKEIWKTPGWEWGHDFIIDDVYYFHGTGNGGNYPAANVMRKMLMNCVLGHNHARHGVYWKANPLRRIFGVDTGCGINVDAFQFAYGKHIKIRPILGAAVIVDGVPYTEIMPCGRGEIYHKSNFEE